jgi:hypothetical protein
MSTSATAPGLSGRPSGGLANFSEDMNPRTGLSPCFWGMIPKSGLPVFGKDHAQK